MRDEKKNPKLINFHALKHANDIQICKKCMQNSSRRGNPSACDFQQLLSPSTCICLHFRVDPVVIFFVI